MSFNICRGTLGSLAMFVEEGRALTSLAAMAGVGHAPSATHSAAP
jgi:hypothetical protein